MQFGKVEENHRVVAAVGDAHIYASASILRGVSKQIGVAHWDDVVAGSVNEKVRARSEPGDAVDWVQAARDEDAAEDRDVVVGNAAPRRKRRQGAERFDIRVLSGKCCGERAAERHAIEAYA